MPRTRLDWYRFGERISYKGDLDLLRAGVAEISDFPDRAIHELYRVFCLDRYAEFWAQPFDSAVSDFRDWLLTEVNTNPKWW